MTAIVLLVSHASAQTPACPADMVLVRGGAVILGGSQPVNPPHSVTLQDFCIDRFEMSNAKYDRCAAAGMCPWRPPSMMTDMPAVGFDAFVAQSACAFQHRRLPTNDEWEYAARGQSRDAFPWDNGGDPSLWETFGPVTRASVDVSIFGVRNLATNIAEWTATTTATGLRIVAGGSRWSPMSRIDQAIAIPPTTARPDLGARCARWAYMP